MAHDPIIPTTLKVYGICLLPDKEDKTICQLSIVTEAGIMNALQLYQRYVIPDHVTFNLWADIAMAVQIMHTKHILHQDLKPENILITEVIVILTFFPTMQFM